MNWVRFGQAALLALSVAAQAQAEPVKLSHRDRLYDVTAFGGALYVVGHPGLLLRSRDAGKTFEMLAGGQKDEALFSVAFNTKGLGAVVGRSGYVLLSEDGGNSWRAGSVLLGEEKPSLFGVAVLEDGTIVAVGEFGAIARSTDRGKSWQRSPYAIELPANDAQGCTQSSEGDNSDVINEARLTDVRFVDAQRGFAVGEFGLVLTTDDGGLTFKRQNSCTDNILYGIGGDAQRLVAAGAEGTVLETRDGGQHWRVLPRVTSEHLFGVYADATRTLVVGAAGSLLVGKGEGALREVNSGVHSWLVSAYLDAQGKGVIVGGRANLLTTRDGGATQTRSFGE